MTGGYLLTLHYVHVLRVNNFITVLDLELSIIRERKSDTNYVILILCLLLTL